MIDRGATTMWERWNGIDADGVLHESLNHYSKGAVISFLHRYVAGLRRLEPTWRRFRVEPMPGGGITSASTEHLSPHGRIAVSWTMGESLELSVTVPPGCVADVVLSRSRWTGRTGNRFEVGTPRTLQTADESGSAQAWQAIGPPLRATISGQRAGMRRGTGGSYAGSTSV